MNAKERKQFWIALCSVKGDNLEIDNAIICDKIILPRFLYRYREVSINTLEALRTNRMFFSSANYFDDPFDTFLHINLEKIRKQFESNFQSPKKVKFFLSEFKKVMGNSLNQYLRIDTGDYLNTDTMLKLLSSGFTDNFISYVEDLRNELKKDTWSVCFSENGFNEVLWLKYAQQHKGFSLIYDLHDENKLLCGKMDQCKNCAVGDFNTPLYPIYYSNKKYDATNFAKYILLKKFKEEFPNIEFEKFPYLNLKYQTWERERTTLVKKKCHEYDQEWRMIASCNVTPPILRQWIPSGIILGLRMHTNEENLVINLAKQAGIKRIYKSHIDKAGNLNAHELLNC